MYLQHKSESTPYIQTKYSVIIRFLVELLNLISSQNTSVFKFSHILVRHTQQNNERINK